jgi:hypothetical protein
MSPAKHILSEVEGVQRRDGQTSFQIRNPKSETILNDSKSQSSKQAGFGFRHWDLRY